MKTFRVRRYDYYTGQGYGIEFVEAESAIDIAKAIDPTWEMSWEDYDNGDCSREIMEVQGETYCYDIREDGRSLESFIREEKYNKKYYLQRIASELRALSSEDMEQVLDFTWEARDNG